MEYNNKDSKKNNLINSIVSENHPTTPVRMLETSTGHLFELDHFQRVFDEAVQIMYLKNPRRKYCAEIWKSHLWRVIYTVIGISPFGLGSPEHEQLMIALEKWVESLPDEDV